MLPAATRGDADSSPSGNLGELTCQPRLADARLARDEHKRAAAGRGLLERRRQIRQLLDTAGMHDYEQIQIYNVTNGERFTTYAMRAEAGSGIISINGAAAHRAKPGDIIIICAYCQLNAAEAINHKPRLIYLNEHNKVTRTSNAIPVQAA